ncbi:MAG: hypothetical protein Q8Q16_06310, partial [Betaproteobacteria bacterium]|nr:hypothetical protein [Betaproteobacteria bacterium]
MVTNLAGGGAEKAIVKLAAGLADKGHEVELALLEDRVEHARPRGVKVSALTTKASKGWIGKRRLAHRLTRHLSAPWNLLVSTLPFADEVTALAKLPRHWCRIANTLSSEVVKLAADHPAKARRRLARYRRLYGARPLIAVSIGIALGLIIQPGLHTEVTAEAARLPSSSGSWLDFLKGLIPSNILGLQASTRVTDGAATTSLNFNVLQIL